MDVFPLVEEHRKGAILMAQGNQVTLVGNLTDDPELRYTPQGTPVATFTVAINRRTRDEGGQWKDGETSFFRCNVWRQQAEHVAESLSKGARAIVIGRLRQRSWETPEGQKRTVVEVEVESVGPSLEWATAAVTKTQRQDFGGSEGGGGGGAPAYANAGNGSNGAAIEEEPPF